MTPPATSPLPLRVLFIGNSFTARNDLPRLIARLAASRGKPLQHQLVSAGGASLRRHWNAGEALEAVRSRRPDYVVLQEQSTLPIKSAARMHESVRLFDDAIRASGGRTALYETWARLNAPQTQRAISEAYGSIARELGATLVPVGSAWAAYMHKGAEPALHDRDQSHPTPAGTYLAACVFLAVLMGEDPRGLDCAAEGVDAGLGRALAAVAWRVARAKTPSL